MKCKSSVRSDMFYNYEASGLLLKLNIDLLNKVSNVEVSDTCLPAGRQQAMPHKLQMVIKIHSTKL
jgi:hypothetical protein